MWLGMHASYSSGIYKIEMNKKNQIITENKYNTDFAGALLLFTSLGCFKETSWLGHDEQSLYRQSFLRHKSASLSPFLSLLKLSWLMWYFGRARASVATSG